uniref:Neprosin domain-containing protein n=1 Tax=Ananas comosus var. bracteatus TaxID=296719 RepID=A0A6V7PT42_ANACO|nr:unnamed protein product [Ananas comosus var. bracteatus]
MDFSSVKAALLSLMICDLLWISCIEAKRWRLTEEEDAKLETQLKILNKPYVKSFKVANGDIIDCVDIYKQPAFDHPLLKNHTLQLRPSSAIKNAVSGPSGKGKHELGVKESCPEGYVPIRRTRKEDLIRAKEYAQHLQLKRSNHVQSNSRAGNHYAIYGWFGDSLRFYGAEALMDVYNLPGVLDDQSSSAQIILEKGDGGPEDYINTIQVGWNVEYKLNGDNLTRFFVYWTDPSNLNWYVLTSDETVGYFPKEIFNNMADSNQIEMGGIVHTPPSELSSPPWATALTLTDGEALASSNKLASSMDPRTAIHRLLLLTTITMPHLCTVSLSPRTSAATTDTRSNLEDQEESFNLRYE